MKTKNLIFLIIILAVVAILSVRLNQLPTSHHFADQQIGEGFVDTAIMRKTKNIQIDFSDRDSLNFKAGSGNTWFISSFNDFPADFSQLTVLSKDLTEIKILRNVSTDPVVLSRLKLGLHKITLRDSEDNILQELSIGKEDQKGGQYVKKSDSEQAYLLERSISLQNDPSDWIDSSVLDIDINSVQTFSIPSWEENQPPLDFAKIKSQDTFQSSYQPAGKTLVDTVVTTFLEELLTISFDEIAEQTDPAVIEALAHRKDFSLQLVSGQRLSLSVARRPEKKELIQPDSVVSKSVDEEESSNLEESDDHDLTEPEYDTIPAGDAYIIYQLNDPSNPWKSVTDTFAFTISSTDFEGLKPDFSTLFEEPKNDSTEPSEE